MTEASERMSDERLAEVRSLYGDHHAIEECLAEIDRLRAELSTRPLPPTEGAVGEENGRLTKEISDTIAELRRQDTLNGLGFQSYVAGLLSRLSASYSAACGERDALSHDLALVQTRSDEREVAAASALSLAIVERDRAREALRQIVISTSKIDRHGIPDTDMETIQLGKLRAAAKVLAALTPAPIPAQEE